MIERDEAVRIVEEQLERDFRLAEPFGRWTPVRMAVAGVERHELVWIVYWTSEEYLRTRNPDLMLGGNGPYLVDRVDGSLHQIGVVSAVCGDWETEYRVRVRGEAVRAAVDDLHDEIRALAGAEGRLSALRVLRRKVPALSPAQASAYVTALRDGDVPAPLVAVAAAELTPVVDPCPKVNSLRGAGHRPPS
ncbi:YrhB domain-containing protein [Streptomyces griseosporeus]